MVNQRVTLIVEGGRPGPISGKPASGKGRNKYGNRDKKNDLNNRCRRGFRNLLSGVNGLKGKMPTIKAGGSRDATYKKFKSKMKYKKDNERLILLVDSEEAVDPQYSSDSDKTQWQPWNHLKGRDGWDIPSGADNNDCHLMVQCMENWLLAGEDRLEKFFGEKFFDKGKLPSIPHIDQGGIDSIGKSEVYHGLEQATSRCNNEKKFNKKSKGALPYDALGEISADKLKSLSYWFQRLVDELERI